MNETDTNHLVFGFIIVTIFNNFELKINFEIEVGTHLPSLDNKLNAP